MKALHRKSRGFTLVELLISFTIVMMILGIGFQGYRLYSNSWKKDLSQFSSTFEAYKTQDLFTLAVRGIIPYMVKAGDKQGFYFLGREEGFTAVTLSPMFNAGASAVIRVFKEPLPNGKFQLVYEEASLMGIVLVSPDQELPFQHRQVIMADLPAIEFGYFGIKSRQSLFDAISSSEGDIPAPEWHSAYDGLQAELNPAKVRIMIDALELVIPVPARSNLGDVTPEVML